MGKNVSQQSYTDHDYKVFQQALYRQLTQLKDILARDNFGDETLKFGAELEMYLIDDNGDISPSNELLLNQLSDPQYQVELNKYNLELNLSAVEQSGKPFTAIRNEMLEKTAKLEEVAAQNNINVLPIGILPTLKKQDINHRLMTDLSRYHCLSNHLFEQRGDAFSVNINGEEPVTERFEDICAEGANTSFQVHMMTKFKDFNNVFNAAQLTIPLVTAIGANSSIFLGNRVWDETRIALFKQSLDIRHQHQFQWHEPTRVNFGFGWLKDNVWELFAQSVALYPPILPSLSDNNSVNNERLEELNMHMGTLWPWHRPVYDHHGNGHMRIEFRAIPAGPTSIDMVANAAFAIGLANGLKDEINDYTAIMPFRYAEYNFYRCAQYGLDAKVLWPLNHCYQLEEVSIGEVIEKLLPKAKQGLLELGIDKVEVATYLAVIKQRLEQRITGAVWQKKTAQHLEQTLDKDNACQQLVKLYLNHCRSAKPVSQWERLWS